MVMKANEFYSVYRRKRVKVNPKDIQHISREDRKSGKVVHMLRGKTSDGNVFKIISAKNSKRRRSGRSKSRSGSMGFESKRVSRRSRKSGRSRKSRRSRKSGRSRKSRRSRKSGRSRKSRRSRK